MAAACERRNPLTRSGANQEQRRLPALQGDTFRLDEREPADLILFAERLSHQIQHYNLLNAKDGDWLPFFATDISAVLAGLSELPVAALQSFARALQEFLADEKTRPAADLSSHFKLLFHLPLMLLSDISAYFVRLPREHPLRGFLATLVATDGEAPVRDLIGYYAGALALAAPLFADTPLAPSDYNTTFNDADPNIQLPSAVTARMAAQIIAALPIDGELVAAIDPAGWSSFYMAAAAAPLTTPYEDSIGEPNELYQQIYDALNYNLLSKAIERLFALAERARLEAQRSLDASLTTFDGHTPHYGLWLAFLRLFTHNQSQLNEFTARHLDFYYRVVLGLCPRKAVADRVHLLFELNKNQTEHLLSAADVRFRGGKDDTGKEILYKLDADIVVNRGQVGALLGFYRPAQLPAGATALGPFAALQVNSGDGAGGKLPKEAPHWRPFGPALGLPTARVGFGVADRSLFLREGARKIVVTLKPSAPVGLSSTSSGLRVWLTGAEGWVELAGAGVVTLSKNTSGALVLTVNLDGSLPMIVAYDAALHGPGFDVALPILRCEFDYAHAPGAARTLHEALDSVRLTDVKLDVEASGLRNFTLQSDVGIVDPSKPFLPFGPTPSPKAAMILGSSELFSKRLAQMTLHLEWAQKLTKTGFYVQAEPGSYKVKLATLAKGAWNDSSAGYLFPLFASIAPNVTIASPQGTSIADSDLAVQSVENETYGPQSAKGFIRLELNNDFGHAEHLTDKTKALIDYAAPPKPAAFIEASTTSTSAPANSSGGAASSATTSAATAVGFNVGSFVLTEVDAALLLDDLVALLRLYNYDGDGIPLDPYSPKAQSLTLSYKVMQAAPAHYFHLYPFGASAAATGGGGRLLPDLANEGELYIGIDALDPPQRLTLLFQVADGTANPLKPPPVLKWDYLQGNAWVPFAEQDVQDGTLNLTGTGIVGLALPQEADTAHTLLPAGRHWVRMAVASDADAVNSLLGIDAQATTATFDDQANDPAFLAAPRAAGTISKLKVGDAAVKKIVQPLPSFGGAAPEAFQPFTIRASERLRHKQRAVTMWDYEHLVLEKLPSVWKVKCINHTLLQRDAQQMVVADNELAPGHVLVVLLPDLRGKAHPSSRLPYADQRTLVAVDGLLRPLMSPFVRLEVQNPRFEEVQVQFDVAFMPGIADTAFYLQELSEAIVRYLSPWAYGDAAYGITAADIEFGGTWHKSSIIDFVEELPYVDYLKNVAMYHKRDLAQPDAQWARVDQESIRATTARSVLVSHAQHIVSAIV